MPISLQADSSLPQGHILVDGQRVASFSTTSGLSATLNQSIVNQIYQIPGSFNFRNKIINGNFDIWQRGTSFPSATNGQYTADRWQLAYDGAGATRNITRESFLPGQLDVPDEPAYFLRWSQPVAGSGALYNTIRQPIESVRTFAGKQITLSFYAKADISLQLSVYGFQYFGFGGSSNEYTNFPGLINVTTSWQKFTVNLIVPSINGKVIGPDIDDCFFLTFQPSPLLVNTTFIFDIAKVQLEEGLIATPFEQRLPQTELALCQRYYFNSNNTSPNPLVRQYNDSAGNRTVPISYTLPVPLRKSIGLDITATGDINDGTAFTIWNTLFTRDARTIYADKALTAGQFLDLANIIVSAEL